MNLLNLTKLGNNTTNLFSNNFKNLLKLDGHLVGGTEPSGQSETESDTPSNFVPKIIIMSNQAQKNNSGEVTPATPVTPITPTVQTKQTGKLFIVFLGLPKCGKTQIAKNILFALKPLGIKTKFIDTPMDTPENQNKVYVDTIDKWSKGNVNVLICNGNNYLQSVRKTIKDISTNSNSKILYVNFTHPEDLENSFTNYKAYCQTTITNRIDSLANINIDEIIAQYQPIADSELESSSIVQVNINDTKQKSLGKIFEEIKKIIGL